MTHPGRGHEHGGTGGVRWRGAHHLALVTRDLDATVRFYHGVLGMPLFGAMAA